MTCYKLELHSFKFLLPDFFLKNPAELFVFELPEFTPDMPLKDHLFKVTNQDLSDYEGYCLKHNYIGFPIDIIEEFIDINSQTGNTNPNLIAPLNIQKITIDDATHILLNWLFNYVEKITDFIHFQFCDTTNDLPLLLRFNKIISQTNGNGIVFLKKKSELLKVLNKVIDEIQDLEKSIEKETEIVSYKLKEHEEKNEEYAEYFSQTIFDYKFCIPTFLTSDEIDDTNKDYFTYSEKLGTYQFIQELEIDYERIEKYYAYCHKNFLIPLPLKLFNFNKTNEALFVKIRPFNFDTITEEDCNFSFFESVFRDINDYRNFFNNQIQGSTNPLFILDKMSLLVSNISKGDIKTLKLKKDILSAINTAISEIENLNNSVQELQNEKVSQPLLIDIGDKNLTAVQKLLFIRLLQDENLFPKRNSLSETKRQEFEYLAPLIGSNYQELKSAESKVEKILSKKLTEGQKVAKINDLNNVKSKFEKIIQVIEQLKLDIEKI